MNTRTLTESDYEILSDWWKAWSWPVMAKDMLPDNGTGGIMVEHEGENIVAGFLYWSNSKLVWLDWIISNPKSDKDIRQEAIGSTKQPNQINGLASLQQALESNIG